MFRYLLLGIPLLQLCCSTLASARVVDLPPRLERQVGQLAESYRKGRPYDFTRHSASLIKLSKPEQLEKVNQVLGKNKFPDLQDMIGEVRIRAMMADVKLPQITWHEFAAVVPYLIQQSSELKQEFEASEYFKEAIPPKGLKAFEKKFWELHVFRNRFNAFAKAAEQLQASSRFFKRQMQSEKTSDKSNLSQPISRLPTLASELYGIRNLIDEREAVLRVHRTSEAESQVGPGEEFEVRLRAAYALADDRLFFERFLSAVEKEKRVLVDADLQDESILKMVAKSSANAKEKHKDLFDKAALFYVGAHWWLRGRYGQGPLANGLLKSVDAARSEQALFPLLMPAQMPDPSVLIGKQAPYQPVRRHNYVWGLGVDQFDLIGPSRTIQSKQHKEQGVAQGEVQPLRIRIDFDQFH